jgi:hypothetical protein
MPTSNDGERERNQQLSRTGEKREKREANWKEFRVDDAVKIAPDE